jgi:hypothetical protein
MIAFAGRQFCPVLVVVPPVESVVMPKPVSQAEGPLVCADPKLPSEMLTGIANVLLEAVKRSSQLALSPVLPM